jgi:16S rRNA (guanine527-N7)-methyltransferase
LDRASFGPLFHVKRSMEARASQRRGGDDPTPLLLAYAEMLRERAVPLGLIGPGDEGRIFERHVADSCRAVPCIPEGTRSVLDIGSGAGLPGVPVAILRPDLLVTLLEPSRRRVGFLEFVIGELHLDGVQVIARRAEDADLAVDLAMARAVSDAVGSWRLAERCLRPAGSLLYFAGASWAEPHAEELAEAGATARVCSGSRAEGGPIVVIRAGGASAAVATDEDPG